MQAVMFSPLPNFGRFSLSLYLGSLSPALFLGLEPPLSGTSIGTGLNNAAIRLCLGGGLGYIMIHPRFVKLM
jgi:hypothetical protein